MALYYLFKKNANRAGFAAINIRKKSAWPPSLDTLA